MNPNTEFELFTQRIYQKLVDNDVLKPTTVEHNVKRKGRSGCGHQIDVYWEYEIAGNQHRVAIECKNYDSLVPVGKVLDFQGVLSDLNNVNGIMVSKKRIPGRRKKYAAEYGISLKELRQPGWNDIIGSTTTVVHTDFRNTLFLFDDEWLKSIISIWTRYAVSTRASRLEKLTTGKQRLTSPLRRRITLSGIPRGRRFIPLKNLSSSSRKKQRQGRKSSSHSRTAG